MRYLRSSVIANLVFLTFFFNIERVDLGQKNLVDISSLVYPLVIAAMLSVLIVPWLRHRTMIWSMSGWVVIFIGVKMFRSSSRPAFGGIYTYLTLTELLFLLVGIVLAHRLGQALNDFEETVENLTMAGASRRVKKPDAATEEIQIELGRSRRFNRNLIVTVVEPDPRTIDVVLHQSVMEVQQKLMARYVTASLARAISSLLRRSDLIIDQHEEGRLVIFSPDTDVAEAQLMEARIRSVAGNLGAELGIGMASFPDQALTFEELVLRAELNMKTDSDRDARPLGESVKEIV
jgi:hypothetical protein